MTTKDKSHTPTQTELIEAELELLFTTHSKECRKGNKCCYGVENGSTQDFMKQLAALILKHRHDVYFQAFKDGVVAGRKEGKAEGIAALEGLTFYDRWNKSDELPAEIEKRIALLKGDDDTVAGRS